MMMEGGGEQDSRFERVAQRSAASGKVKQAEQVQTEVQRRGLGDNAATGCTGCSRQQQGPPLPQFPERDGGKGGNPMDQWAA